MPASNYEYLYGFLKTGQTLLFKKQHLYLQGLQDVA